MSARALRYFGSELWRARAWSKSFPTAMGGDLDYFRQNDPFTLSAKNADALRDRTLIRIVCHVEDENWLAPRCEALHRVLVEQTIPHEFYYLSNVKSHNRAAVLDTLGDAEFAFFSSALAGASVSPRAAAKGLDEPAIHARLAAIRTKRERGEALTPEERRFVQQALKQRRQGAQPREP